MSHCHAAALSKIKEALHAIGIMPWLPAPNPTDHLMAEIRLNLGKRHVIEPIARALCWRRVINN
jgi:hypothetical protein